MANIIATYTRDRGAAKANIEYITRRPGREGEKITRTLFGLDGAMDKEEAYRMIEEAKNGSYFYRLVLSPDPNGEDTQRDLHMRELTLKTMMTLDKRLQNSLVWAGTLHADHAPHRHVHILAISPRRLTREDFKALRLTATQESQSQRRVLDNDREQTPYLAEKPSLQLTRDPILKIRQPENLKSGNQESPQQSNPATQQTSRQGGGRSRIKMHICSCPKCGATHVEYGQRRAHPCTCGFLMHKKKEQALRRKGVGRQR